MTTRVEWIANDADAARYGGWYPGPEPESLVCERCGSIEDVSARGADGTLLCVDCLELGTSAVWEGYYDAVYGEGLAH